MIGNVTPENTWEQTGHRRLPRTAWKPGQSGNPGGRPRELADVKALARQHTAEAIETLVELMRSGKTDSARAAAASELLSRAWGKPSLPLLHENGPPQFVLSEAQHASLLEALHVVAAQRSDEPGTMKA